MKINNIYKVFFVLNLFFILNQTKAQTWTSFSNPTYVKSIVFDNQGNQWIGTTYGLVKFDGSKYTNYDWTNGLSDNTINSIAVDNQGKIWVGTRNGVSMYNGSIWVKFFTTDGLANNYVSSIAIDSNGDKWFGTLCGLTKYNGSNWTTYKTNNGLVNDTINFIKIDNQGNKWIATRNGVSRFDGTNWINYQMYNGYPLFGDRSVLSIGIDNNNKLYFGTMNYIRSFDGLNWQTLINNTGTYTYPKNFCYALLDSIGRIWFSASTQTICFVNGNSYTSFGGGSSECCSIDQNGNLWFGSSSGLVKYDQIKWTSIKIPSLFETYNSSLKLLLCDSENNLWFSGSKIFKYTGYEWEVLNYPNTSINIGNSTKIYEDQQKNIWFGGTFGLIKYDGNNFVLYNTTNGLPNNSIVDINSDLQGNIWIATTSSGIAKFNGSNFTIYNTSNSGLASNSVNNIIIDEQNNKWFTTSGNGVIKYNGSTWTTYKTPTGTGNNYFNKVLIDTTGEKWFIRSGVGIARYNDINWTEYSTANGLISNYINGIFFDKQHNIWAYSNSGVSKFDGSTWTSYNTANGLANNYINNGIADNDGNVWFNSSYNGLSKYDGSNWTIFGFNNNYYNFNVNDIINDKEGNLWYSGGGVFRYSKCNLSANDILISGQTDLCKGLTNLTYSIPAILNATQYEWELPDGVVGNSNTNSINVNISQNAVSGKIYVRGKNSCGSSTRVSKQIIVSGTIPAVPDSIIGKKYVCKPDTITYMVPPVSGATSYIWTLPQGAAGNSTTNSIKVIFSNNAQSGVISVKAKNNCGIGSQVSAFISFTGVYPAAAGNILGNANFCNTQNIQAYSVPLIANADTIIWELPYNVPGIISNNSVVLTFNNGNYNTALSVYGKNSCGNGPLSNLKIRTYNNLNGSLGNISGNSMICSGQSTELYSIGNYSYDNVQTYHWSLPSGVSTLDSKYLITANYANNAISGNISVYGSNPCGISQTSVLPIIISNILPSNAGSISGNTNVAKSQSNIIYSVSPIANAVEYVWTLPSGATGVSTTNSISVSYGSSAISGNISVCGKNGCGQGVSSSLLITVNGTVPSAPNNISGSNKVCKGQNGLTYYTNTIANATSYQWTLPNGITGSSITNNITVNVGQNAVNGQIKVRGLNSYGAGDSAVLNVTINSPLTSSPSVISGPDTLAFGQTQIPFAVINDTNVNNYIWTVPQGMSVSYATSGNAFVNVSATAVAGNISVIGENACGTSAASLKPVIIGGSVPIATGSITGLTQACQGQSNLVYTVQPMANATSYIWTKPDGTKDTTINNYINLSLNNINYYPNLSVYGRNKFGNSSTLSLQIYIKTPVSFNSNVISGLDTVYKMQCNVTYNLNIYSYSYVNGDVITWNYSGNGATLSPYIPGDNINISFSSTATSGVLSAFVNNPCGQSVTLTKQITVMQPIDYVESCNTISNISNYNSIDWGDFNNDGYLDFIYCGINAYSTKIFKNLGNGNFIELNTPNIPNVSKGTAKWGDYNNDGFIDFMLLGSAGSNNYIAKIYKNNGNETFTEQNNLILPSFNQYFSSTASWADYNNDGFLDLLITGVLSPSTVMFSKIFKNNGDNTFTEQTNINLVGFSDASTAWGDFNNDSYLDLLMTGYSDLVYGNYATRLYKNDKNGNFNEVYNSNLMPAHGANAVWGDYDNDGRLDILISGDTFNSGSNQLHALIRIYKNSGSDSFIWQNQIVIDPFDWSGGSGDKAFNTIWGDYNNDGLLDVITSGYPINNTLNNFILYKNNGNNTFDKKIIKNTNSSDDAIVSLADIDNDGDLDGIQNYKINKSYINYTSESGLCFYKNYTSAINTKPIPPANLTSTPNNNQVLLKWSRGSDAETPLKGLTYNIRVGTFPGGSNIMNPMANPVTGKRAIVENGNTSQDTTWILKNLLPGTYYWAVQTIDNAYNGSVFSQENSFTLCSNPIISASSITGQSNICAGQSNIKYKVAALTNATSYIWSLPDGSIGNSNSDSIIVSFTNSAQSGNITVKGFNNCGYSDSIVYPVKVFNSLPAKPLAITGNSSVCEGNDSVFFSTPFQSDATSYIWLSSFAGPVINSPNYTYVNINSNNQNNYIAVKAENICGISDSLTKPIIIKTKPLQPSSISGIQDLCLGQSNVNYSILPVSNAIFYQWTLPNAITGNSITNSINVNAVSNLASGNISVRGMNSCGEGIQSSLNLVVNTGLPNITDSISGPVNIIAGQQNVVYTCSSINNASSYIWTLPDGSIDTTSTNSINYSFQVNAQTANISVKGLNACGVGSSKSLTVNIVNLLPVSADTILGGISVCQGYNNVVYTVPPIANASFYIWTLPNGTFGNSTTNSISVNFGSNAQSGIISVKGRNLMGDGDSAILFVTVNQLPLQPSVIMGDTIVCQGQSNVKYKINPIQNTTSYVWTLPNGISGNSSSDSILLNFSVSAQTGIISVKGQNSCGTGSAKAQLININQLPANAATISGLANVCQGQNSVVYSIPSIFNASSYNWVLPSGVNGNSDSNSIILNIGISAVSGNIIVKGLNSCGFGNSSAKSINVQNAVPSTPLSITGSAAVCVNQNNITYSVNAISNANSYQWSLPSGTIGNSSTNSITVSYGANAISGNISVKGINSCGLGQESIKAITVGNIPVTAGNISGAITVCQGQANVVYTVPAISNATSYTWTLPSGASGSSSTNSINVSFNSTAVSGNVTVKGVNSCGSGTSSSLSVIVNSIPSLAGNIVGLNTICNNQNNVIYQVSNILNAVSYIWTLPTGASGNSSSNNINVNFANYTQTGVITVKGQNACGTGQSSSITINSSQPPGNTGVINGNSTVCQGQTNLNYFVSGISNATSYVWTLPFGTSGYSTNSNLNATFGLNSQSGNISVYGQNSCGVSQTINFPVIVNSLPNAASAINGANQICQGEINVPYSIAPVLNANSYIWTLPQGASGNSNTNTIYVNFPNNSQSGNISVKGINLCGDGLNSTLAVNIKPTPQTPVITQINDTLFSNISLGNQWFNLTTGIINNATSQTFHPFQIGNYFTIVTLNGCKSDTSNIIYYDNTGIEINSISTDKLKIYPNPAKNNLTIELSKSYNLQNTTIYIYNIQGQLFKQLPVNQSKTEIDIYSFVAGVYIVKVNNDKETLQGKFVKE